MPKGTNRKPNIFQRIAQTVKRTFQKVTGTSTEIKQDLSTPKDKGVIRKMIQRIRPPKTGQVSGTSKRIPTAKYTDYEVGWGKDKGLSDITKTLEESGTDLKLPSGTIVKRSEIKQLEELVKMSENELQRIRENIVENVYSVYGEIEGMDVELQMERAVQRERRKFTSAIYDELRDVDVERLIREMDASGSPKDFLAKLLTDGDGFTQKANAIRYRDNWAEALKNTYGDNSKTRYIIDTVYTDLDLNTFMLTLYNPASNLHIEVVYSSKEEDNYLTKMLEEIEVLKEKQATLKPIM